MNWFVEYWPLAVSLPLWATLFLVERWAMKRRDKILEEFKRD